MQKRLGRITAAMAVSALALGFASPSHAQDAAEQSAHSHLPAGTQALIAEIESLSEGDQSRDPQGDLARLAEMRKRVEADANVPPTERGLFESAVGAAQFYARDYEAAAETYGKAAQLFGEGNAPPDEMAGLYNNQASILASLARYDEAEASHRKALAIRRTIEGERGPMVASSLFGIGYVYYRQGRIEESIEMFRESVDQQMEFIGAENPLTIMRFASLASVLGNSGREAEALVVARQAEELGRQHLGDEHPTYAITLNNLGNALIENGLYAEALPVLRETLRVRQQTVGEAAGGTAISLRNLATALKMTGDIAESEELNLRALEIYSESGETDTPATIPYLYAELANFAADRGEWDTFEDLSAKSLAAADAALGDDNYDRAQLHLYRAERLRERGMDEQALQIAQQWVPVMQAALIPRHKDRLWAEMLLARLQQENGQDALPAADAAFEILKDKLSDLAVTDRQLVREAQVNRDIALLYLEMAIAAGDRERVFAALQVVNISDLSLGQQFASNDAGGSGAYSARRELLTLARRVEEVRKRYNASLEIGDAEQSAALQQDLDHLQASRDAVDARLRREYPEFVALMRPAIISLAEFTGQLDQRDLLVAPVEGQARSWQITVSRDMMDWREIDRDRVHQSIAAIRASVDDPVPDLGKFPLADANALYRELFPQGVKAKTRILFHGGGALASIPLGLLVTDRYSGDLRDAPWLAREAAVRVVGNLALVNRQGRRERPAGTGVFAGIGGVDLGGADRPGAALASLFRSGRPDYRSISELPPLPEAEGELRRIAAALPGEDMLMLGSQAAEEHFKSADFSNASIIAFATHGLIAGEIRDLWEPALLLGTADPSSGEDGLLGASEIAQLELAADWVILSACNTSAGDRPGAAAYSGLATAFAQAGADSLMLSHWRVRDDAAARLSVATVEYAAGGLDHAEALRLSELDLIADRTVAGGGHPAVWAPFVIVRN